MTPDIRSLINECTTASGQRIAGKRLRRKTRAGYTREIAHLHKLVDSIKTIHHSVLCLKLIRAPRGQIDKLEAKLRKRQARLASVTNAINSGWHHAWQNQVRANSTNRFYWLGVSVCRNGYNLSKLYRKTSSFVLRDNWGTKASFASPNTHKPNFRLPSSSEVPSGSPR